MAKRKIGKSKPTKNSKWVQKVTLRDLAELLGATVGKIQHWSKTGMPGKVKAGEWDVHAVVTWWAENILAAELQSKARAELKAQEGSALPELRPKDRLDIRRERLLMLEEDQLAGRLLPKEHVLGALGMIRECFSNMTTTLVREYGDEAADIVNDAIDESQRLIDEFLKPTKK